MSPQQEPLSFYQCSWDGPSYVQCQKEKHFLFFKIFFNSRNSMPKTSYIKASGYWMLLCYTSVFYCLIEFCIIITLTHKSQVASKNNHNINIRSTEEQLPSSEVIVYLSASTMYLDELSTQLQQQNTDCMTSLALKIEAISRVVIPIYSWSYTVIYFIICVTM